MNSLPESLRRHRIRATDVAAVCDGQVRHAPLKSAWFVLMLLGTVVGCVWHFSLDAFAVFLVATSIVLLFGHSLGSHRKLIHNSYQCPKWLEYLFVYCGVQVGLSGPLGLLQQHELRDYAQRLPTCHDYLRHGRTFWIDAWWQLNCELHLARPPQLRIEPHIAEDRFYRFLERTWMAQQLPWAGLLFLWGGWSYVCWGVCARVLAGVGGHWLIGYFAHNHGEMSYEVSNAAVQGRNIRWTSLLTMGECWHNNHHAFPGSAKLGLRAGEWDPGWWVLSALQRCGLVWQVRLPADLPPRPELVPLVETRRGVGLRHAIGLAMGASKHLPLVVRWPARRLSERALLLWFGNNVDLQRDPQAHRLSVHLNGTSVLGLPAVWIAMAHRCTTARVLSWLVMPLAFGLEQLRSSPQPR
jgi:stearoyl-CoA desaturase (delta-9 desaturase)